MARLAYKKAEPVSLPGRLPAWLLPEADGPSCTACDASGLHCCMPRTTRYSVTL